MINSIDHIGIVVRSIEKSIATYIDVLGYELETDVIFVSSQNINCRYIMHPENRQRLQLIEPVDDSSPVYNFLLKTGGGLNHICYSVDNIHEAIDAFQAKGCKILGKPFRGEGVGNAFAVFMFHPDIGLTELVERSVPDNV